MASPLIHFHGASKTVTGSCYLIESEGTRIVVDCGLFQGSKTEKELNYRPFPFDPKTVDAVIVTHAHIDHTGLLPKLVKDGFSGPIFATAPTIDLCSVMLPDSAHIQEVEVEQLNRRNRHRARQEVMPIYTIDDAMAAMTQFRPVRLEQWHQIVPSVRIRLWNAGHLLGSTSIEMEIAGPPVTKILFSGDIGPNNKLLETEPKAPSGWDYVLCESTYGDRDRQEKTDDARRLELARIVREAARHRNGALVIPSFAVERTQELLSDLVRLMDEGKIPDCPVIIDSPLAARASEVFNRHAREIEDGERLVHALHSRKVRFTESVEQSKALDLIHGFHIVMAASGMCEAGRIRHRLKNWLWREEGTILLVGYQAQGTLGRILEDGAPVVKIQGEEIIVRAKICNLDAYSGHADGRELADWVRARLPISKALFLVHGEDASIEGMKERLSSFVGENKIYVPRLDSAFRLDPDGPADISPEAPPPRMDPSQAGHRDWNNDYQNLLQDLQEQLRSAADDRQRSVLIRRIRKALENG